MSDGLHDADEAASAPERLAREHDEQVRTVLARRIASMVPTLDGPTQAHLRRHVLAILFKLVEDECVRVRAAIADAVKDMPQAPRKLVLQLAYDVDISVCGPVIRLSPLLTDADLLELLRTAPCPEAATAVARRPALNETVSDAIAAAANTNAVRALLANQSASIREATLDSLIAQSVNHTDWHDHLVRRPVLSSRAARALSRMVTARLLRVMCERGDLEPALAEELRQRLAERLAEQPAPEPAPDMSAQEAMAAARQLQAQQSRWPRGCCWRHCSGPRCATPRRCWPSPRGCRWPWSTGRRRCAAPRGWSAWPGRPGFRWRSRCRCRRSLPACRLPPSCNRRRRAASR
jgi:uncharacterized protein (DUF2336 family)